MEKLTIGTWALALVSSGILGWAFKRLINNFDEWRKQIDLQLIETNKNIETLEERQKTMCLNMKPGDNGGFVCMYHHETENKVDDKFTKGEAIFEQLTNALNAYRAEFALFSMRIDKFDKKLSSLVDFESKRFYVLAEAVNGLFEKTEIEAPERFKRLLRETEKAVFEGEVPDLTKKTVESL